MRNSGQFFVAERSSVGSNSHAIGSIRCRRRARRMHHAARREMRANEYSAMPGTGKPRSADRYFRPPRCALQLAGRTGDAFSGGPARSAESTETTPIRALINWMSFAAARDRTAMLVSPRPDARGHVSGSRRLPDAGCSASPANRRTCDRGASAASRAVRVDAGPRARACGDECYDRGTFDCRPRTESHAPHACAVARVTGPAKVSRLAASTRSLSPPEIAGLAAAVPAGHENPAHED